MTDNEINDYCGKIMDAIDDLHLATQLTVLEAVTATLIAEYFPRQEVEGAVTVHHENIASFIQDAYQRHDRDHRKQMN